MAKRGHSVDILTTEGEELKKFEGLINVWYISKNWAEIPFVRSLSEDPWLLVYALIFGLKAFPKLLTLYLKGTRYDVISVHCTLEAFIMRWFKRLFRTPYVFVFEGYTNLEARMARNADLQIAISNAITQRCYNKYGYKPIAIPVGIDQEQFKPNGDKISFGKGKKIVLTVSRLNPPKDVLTLVSAAKIVCDSDPSFIFLIVGEGEEKKKIENQIDKLNLKDKVILVGGVDDNELPIYYRSADIFVCTHPSVDQFWITVLEAMSSGLPVIWTSVKANPRENWGIPVPPKKPRTLAKRILEIASNEELYRKLAENSLTKASDYSWNEIILKYEKAFESTIK